MNRVKKLVPFLLLIIAVICFFSFSGTDSSKKIRISDKELPVVAEITDESLFISETKRSKMKEIASSGMLKMYLDEKTMALCVYDVISGSLYRSLPEEYAGEKPSPLCVNVLLEGREYCLSSQSDSLSFDCIDYETADNGVTITYNFRRSLEGKEKLDISVPVTYSLTDGALTAGIDCNKIYNEGKAIITSVSLLEYFGADSASAKGDYLLLPEGCGAIVDLGAKSESFESISLPVYGGDPAVYNGNSCSVPVGAFGRKCGNSAFVCLVSEGETLCSITADKVCGSDGYNRVGAVFTVTPTVLSDDNKYVYVSEDSYKGNFQVCYRFLNGDSADYIGMASAVRELLIRQGKLSEKSKSGGSYYPFNLSLIMSEKVTDENSNGKIKILTSYTQAYELLASLKAKGFADINVRLRDDEAKDSRKEKELMFSLGDDGSVRFYAESQLLSGNSNFVKDLGGEKLSYVNTDKINKTLNDYISSMRNQNIYGICIDDAGKFLASDFGRNKASLRENVKNSLNDIFSSISASESLMISQGNLYSIKYADYIIDLSQISSLDEKEHISSVPFIQAILHGIRDYSHSACNISEDAVVSMLKAAEYGAVPHFEWHCTAGDEAQGEDLYYYMNSVSQAKAFYDRMKDDFAHIRGRRITGHKKIKEDVYLTRFGEDCSVYVNYSSDAVSVAGITVGAKSYAVVNG